MHPSEKKKKVRRGNGHLAAGHKRYALEQMAEKSQSWGGGGI